MLANVQVVNSSGICKGTDSPLSQIDLPLVYVERA